MLPETIHQLVMSVSCFFTIYGTSEHIAKSVRNTISYIGKNTLSIYVFHFYIVYGWGCESVWQYNQYYQTVWGVLASVLVIGIILFFTIPIRCNKTMSALFLGIQR